MSVDLEPCSTAPPRQKPRVRGELALCLIAVLNSFSVYLMLYSGGGITAISSVPFILSEVFPFCSLGLWTYLFQTSLIAVLMILRRRFVGTYLLSFVVGGAFSFMMDVHALWINLLPKTIPWCLFYFILSFFCLAFGIALSNYCKLPIVPTDLFPRELAFILKKPYKRVKTPFDVICLFVTVAFCLFALHDLRGIGIGTVICAFTMGKVIFAMGHWLDSHFTFVSFLEPEEKELMQNNVPPAR